VWLSANTRTKIREWGGEGAESRRRNTTGVGFLKTIFDWIEDEDRKGGKGGGWHNAGESGFLKKVANSPRTAYQQEGKRNRRWGAKIPLKKKRLKQYWVKKAILEGTKGRKLRVHRKKTGTGKRVCRESTRWAPVQTSLWVLAVGARGGGEGFLQDIIMTKIRRNCRFQKRQIG